MVPVLDKDKNPLMPCTERRAKILMEKGKAKPYWCKGIFCIILQEDPKSRFMQDIVIGIDPGSKFNGYTVKSEAHTLKNLQVNAITTVKDKIVERSILRRSRRQRNTPYRKCRFNRAVRYGIPPSTKSRWQQHLNIVKWMSKLYNVTCVAIEDIKSMTLKGAKKWNKNFSPLEVGKKWFEEQVNYLNYKLYKFQGFHTAEMRKEYGLKKNKDKAKKCFYTHCVDSWVLANRIIGGHTEVDSKHVVYLKPLVYARRKLHEILPKRDGFRRWYGSTLSLGITRGTLVSHFKYGLSIVGGTSKGRVSLHNTSTNKRITQLSLKEDLKIKTILRYNFS
jgi:hypothetical protein